MPHRRERGPGRGWRLKNAPSCREAHGSVAHFLRRGPRNKVWPQSHVATRKEGGSRENGPTDRHMTSDIALPFIGKVQVGERTCHAPMLKFTVKIHSTASFSSEIGPVTNCRFLYEKSNRKSPLSILISEPFSDEKMKKKGNS